MDLSPKMFREVEFREKMRGYHPEDVDKFLEEMAGGVEALQDRLRQATQRAERAEQAATEASSGDETLKRTLVLAQRTADLAVHDAREHAAKIVASAEQQGHTIVAEAEERARRLHGEALADVHAELAKLEATRAQAQQEVDALTKWADEHKAHLRATLQEAIAVVDKAELQSPPPSSSPIDVPFARRSGAEPVALPPVPVAEGGQTDTAARPTTGGPPVQEQGKGAATTGQSSASQETQAVAVQPGDEQNGNGQRGPQADAGRADQETAMDNFFEDADLDDDHRFGGRLRRRR